MVSFEIIRTTQNFRQPGGSFCVGLGRSHGRRNATIIEDLLDSVYFYSDQLMVQVRGALLRTEHERRRGTGGNAARDRSHEVRQDKGSHDDQPDLDERHGGFGDGVNVASEYVPQPLSRGHADGRPYDDAYESRDRSLPANRPGELAPSKTKGFQQRQVTSAPSYRGNQGEAQSDKGAAR
jgi:hypothetical protein